MSKKFWDFQNFCKNFVDVASKIFFSYGFKENVSEKIGFWKFAVASFELDSFGYRVLAIGIFLYKWEPCLYVCLGTTLKLRGLKLNWPIQHYYFTLEDVDFFWKNCTKV